MTPDETTSGDPGDAVARRGLGVRLWSQISSALCVRQHPEEAVESTRTRHYQEAADPLHHAPVRMWDSTRKYEKGTRADVEPITAALEHVLALQDLEDLIFMLVNVQRRVQERRQLLPCGEPHGRGLDQDCAASEHETFAVLRLDGNAMSNVHDATLQRRLDRA
jgi:hypothetical protein